MKLLTKEQEEAHYNATLKGGALGGGLGLAIGGIGVAAATRRYQFFRQLTLPLKAFLITSAGTFGGIVTADHYSRAFERSQNPLDREYDQRQKERELEQAKGKTFTQRAMDWGRQERYKIVGASWIASMFAAFALVNRNKYLTGQQKLVQARVYAQFLTLGVLVATAAFEISDKRNEEGRYETVKIVDPTDPEHKRMIEKKRLVEESDGDTQWKEMVAAEEQRMKEREEEEKRLRARKQKKENASSSGKKKDDNKKDESDNSKDQKTEDSGAEKSGKKNQETKSANESKNNDDEKSKNKEKSSSK